MPTLEELQQEIDQLKVVVKKQSQLLAKTGEQLLQFQVRQTSDQLRKLEIPGTSSTATTTSTTPQIDTSDFVTNDDLIQLVGELQGQLLILEQRSIDRTINSTLTRDDDKILPILNADGDQPDEKLYPETIKDFKNLKDADLLKLCALYELLPPNYQDEARLQAFIAGKIKTPNLEPGQYEVTPDDYTKETLDGFYLKLANYLGLNIKRK